MHKENRLVYSTLPNMLVDIFLQEVCILENQM